MIELPYGDVQQFRPRHRDVNVIGAFRGVLPVRSATWQLNDGTAVPFYVESVPDEGVDYSYQYKPSPARLRLPYRGDFNVEVPVDGSEWKEGVNRLRLRIVGADGAEAIREVSLSWDPSPVLLPLELTNLRSVRSPQEIGQVVDGVWDVDPELNVIRTRAPAAPDSLLLLGSPAASQEARYEWRYFDGSRSKYIGFSDFFVGHEIEDPAVPIKPGWSTAGLATSRPRGEGVWEARIWIAWGDRPGWRPTAAGDDTPRREFRVVRSDPASILPLQPRRWYCVCHQLLFEGDVRRARFRVWPLEQDEPDRWLCEETDAEAPKSLRRFGHASFGLFQHSGLPSEWRNIHLVALG